LLGPVIRWTEKRVGGKREEEKKRGRIGVKWDGNTSPNRKGGITAGKKTNSFEKEKTFMKRPRPGPMGGKKTNPKALGKNGNQLYTKQNKKPTSDDYH